MDKKSFNEKNFKIFGFNFNLKYTIFGAIFLVLFLGILFLLDNTVTNISWYGVIIGCGFLVALYVAVQLAPCRDFDGDFAYDLLWWIFPFSVVGARAYYCIFEKIPLFWDAFKIWNGGLSILGGIIGGAIGVCICCAIKKANVLKACDVIAPCLIIGQCIGRWGNFVNQEVYGFEVTNKALQWFPFAVYITRGGLNEWHLANFFYESVLSFIGFILLVILCRKVKKTGFVASCYLFYYGLVRTLLESLRMDTYVLKGNSGLPASQITSIIFLILGTIGIITILTIDLIKKRNSTKLVDEIESSSKELEKSNEPENLEKEQNESSNKKDVSKK